MIINLHEDGEIVVIEINRKDYHLITMSLYIAKHFVENRDFHAVSGFSTDDAYKLFDELAEAFDQAAKGDVKL